MWIRAPFLQRKFGLSENRAALIVFLVAIIFRAIPEAIAYPYPLGYDVVNYYIPVVERLPEDWSSIAGNFPIYALILFSMKMLTGLSAHSVVVGTGIGMFGIFALSVFYLARSVLKLGIAHSVFVALFVIVQPAVLRTSWDLHRDVFALSTMFYVFSLLSKRQIQIHQMALILVLSSLTAVADRMIGLLFCISIGSVAIFRRTKLIAAISVLSTIVFLSLLVAGSNFVLPGTSETTSSKANSESSYAPANLVVLFAIFNMLVLAPAIIGFFHIESLLLKIPLLVTLIGAFSWIIFPYSPGFVADRWIVLSGIFIAIFAAYGIVRLVVKRSYRSVLAATVLSAFAVLGLEYAVAPYDEPFPLYGAARQSTEVFAPVTMQFNALDIKDNAKLIAAIEKINRDTEHDAIIVGEKHWRGFMQIYLHDDRTYRFSQNPETLAEALADTGSHVYLITFDQKSSDLFSVARVED